MLRRAVSGYLLGAGDMALPLPALPCLASCWQRLMGQRKAWAAVAQKKGVYVGFSGKGADRRSIYRMPDGLLLDDRGLTVLSAVAKRRRGAPKGVGKGSVGQPAIKTPQRSKYGAVKVDGYASKREVKRAAELKLLQKAGQIRGLREQVEFVLVPKSGKDQAVRYLADFCYEERIAPTRVPAHVWWQAIVEDVKGVRTPVYVLKRRLMLHVHNIRIREV